MMKNNIYHNKKIAIIGASTGQIPICKKAKSLGLETYCFAWEKGAVCKDIVDHFVPISIFEEDKIADYCVCKGINGVVSNASERTAEAVAAIAEKAHLNGTKYDVLISLHDKYYVRLLTNDIEGLEVPQYYKWEGDDKGIYPCVVKPCVGRAKLGVTFVQDSHEFQKAIEYASINENADILVEEYILGKELSVESISYHGEHFVLQITDKDSSSAPHFVELGHHQPANIPSEIKEKIYNVIPKLLSNIGYTDGASHIEVKYNGYELYLIEANLRGGGDEISNRLVELSTGVDYLKCMIDVALDVFEKPIPTRDPAYAGIYFLCKQTENFLPFFDYAKKQVWCVEEWIKNRDLQESHSNYERDGFLIYKSNHKIDPSCRIALTYLKNDKSSYEKILDFLRKREENKDKVINVDWVNKILDRANVICLMNGKDIVAWFVLYCNDKIFNSAYCAGLYVLEQYRKHGFSKVLLAEAIEKSKKAGMKRLNLYCKSDNLVAFALYQSFGFKILKKSRLPKYGNDYYYLLSKNLD